MLYDFVYFCANLPEMDDTEWNVANEGQLLEAMIGHKPVGINKYFQMAFICDKFTDNHQKEINPEKIWRHLETMYNLEALDESESIPFPNNEKDFQLPEPEFGSLLNKKENDEDGSTKKQQKGRETPKPIKEIKKDDKTSNSRNSKERRDSRDSKEKITTNLKKDNSNKRESEKMKPGRNRGNSTPKDEVKCNKGKNEETPKPSKRPTRGSLKPDDASSSGKSSPINTPTNSKRRRI